MKSKQTNTSVTKRVNMRLAEGASSLFGPSTPTKETLEEQRQRRREEERKKKGRRPLFKEHDGDNRNTPDTPKRSRRTWAKPCSANELQDWLQAQKSKREEKSKEGVFTGGGKKKKKNAWCCSLDCVARFCSTVDDDGAQLLR